MRVKNLWIFKFKFFLTLPQTKFPSCPCVLQAGTCASIDYNELSCKRTKGKNKMCSSPLHRWYKFGLFRWGWSGKFVAVVRSFTLEMGFFFFTVNDGGLSLGCFAVGGSTRAECSMSTFSSTKVQYKYEPIKPALWVCYAEHLVF